MILCTNIHQVHIYIYIKSFVKYCLICKLLRIISSTKENKLITVHIMYRRVYIDTWACIIRCCRTEAWGDCLPDELLQCLPKDDNSVLVISLRVWRLLVSVHDQQNRSCSVSRSTRPAPAVPLVSVPAFRDFAKQCLKKLGLKN